MTITEARQVRTDNLCDIPVSDLSTSRPTPAQVDSAIASARTWLWSRQEAAGYWCARLEGDTTLESYVILLDAFLGRRASARSLELARVIRDAALKDGGWSQYPGGPAEISVSCLSYFALKLVGDSADAPHMIRAREAILQLGGIERANTYTQYHFAFFGQFPWSDVPAIPPEMTFLPLRGPFSVYDMSSWSRTIFVPLAILYAHKPVCSIPEECGAKELFTHVKKPLFPAVRPQPEDAWRLFFLGVDRLLKIYEKVPGTALLRRVAVAASARWMTERFAHSDGLSAILPAMANSVLALKVLGYAEDHPVFAEQMEHLEGLLCRDEAGVLRMQPCVSPVWDTVLSCHALIQSGVAEDDPNLRRAASWLLSKQTRVQGDWSGKNRAAPGGWYFEYRNEFYPDVDDTCMALMVLSHSRAYESEAAQREAIRRGLDWMLGMQNSDGGWAAFDRENDKYWLTQIPFADHNAMIDPSTADITGRVLECLSHFPGYDLAHPVVQRAIGFLFRDQGPDGSWYGRWGVNYLYGTWQVLRGLGAIGADMQTAHVRRAVEFLRDHQNPDGGWGESIGSYDAPEQKAVGVSTPSQTAWALMGLIAADEVNSQAVQRGIRYLLSTQDRDGTWAQADWTGTGFPRVFYLNYTMYRHYFPLMALSHYARAIVRG